MSELRHDALSGRTVLVAPGRAARPHTAPLPTASDARRDDCAFCPGNEHETPPEVARVGPGAPDTPGWRVRVVPNKYPLTGGAVPGAHEVVVLSPAHDVDLAALDTEQARAAMRALRDRAAFHLDAGLAHVSAFVNHGRLAGASLEHPHAQLVALALTPPAVLAEAERFRVEGCDLVAVSLDEAHAHGLVVAAHGPGRAPAWCPWAAATPYETLVAHLDAGDDFARATDAELDPVTNSIADVLRRVARALGPVPYNVVFHSTPGGHWYARITVRTFVHAGFEMEAGILVNTVPGEDAAARLCDPS